jgi:hypothetical protein
VVNREGYVLIKRPSHPEADGNGYVREHRLLMAECLGRPLLPEEVVHHIDGDRSNNVVGNLMLFSNGGQHIHYHRRSAKKSQSGGDQHGK